MNAILPNKKKNKIRCISHPEYALKTYAHDFMFGLKSAWRAPSLCFQTSVFRFAASIIWNQQLFQIFVLVLVFVCLCSIIVWICKNSPNNSSISREKIRLILFTSIVIEIYQINLAYFINTNISSKFESHTNELKQIFTSNKINLKYVVYFTCNTGFWFCPQSIEYEF